MSELETPLTTEALRTYERKVLFSCARFEIVECQWKQGDLSALHTHSASSCYVLIKSGSFRETVHSGLAKQTSQKIAEDVIYTAPYAAHEIECVSSTATTLHVYVPGISAQTQAHHFRPADVKSLSQQISFAVEDAGIDPNQLHQLLNQVQENTMAVNSPYFMNQLFSGILPEAIAAAKVLAQTKATAATFEASPVFTLSEVEVVKGLSKLLGWNAETCEGLAVPGGSAANLMAIHCARQKAFPDSKKKGNCGRDFKIFVSESAHYSWKKGAIALGLGTDSIVAVNTDAADRLDPLDLAKKIADVKTSGGIPLLVAATAGTTVFGAFDPIDKMAQICNSEKIWLHVDGAWGGPIVFSKKHSKLLAGVTQADSITFDAHKLLGAGLTSSLFVTTHSQILLEANDVSATYLFHGDGEIVDRGKLSWQCGRPADAFSFWTLWKRYGTDGIEKFVDQQMQLKNAFVDFLHTEPRAQLLHTPEYLNVCVQIMAPHEGEDAKLWSRRVREKIRESDRAMVNYSTLPNGITFLRFILAHPQLEMKHLKDIMSWALEVK